MMVIFKGENLFTVIYLQNVTEFQSFGFQVIHVLQKKIRKLGHKLFQH